MNPLRDQWPGYFGRSEECTPSYNNVTIATYYNNYNYLMSYFTNCLSIHSALYFQYFLN